LRIKILKGKLEGHSFEMQSDILLIGRAPESDIQIPDPSISKLHAKIFKSGEKYFIKDLKSCSGTWVDGRLIWPGNEIELRQGIRLSVGDTLLTLDNFDSDSSNAFSYSIDLA
jgi:pSer/pThr/pTyr-binding forkhead associated (FHA) protein